MSNIDLKNPQVLRNYVECQVREGKGIIVKKTDITVFQGENGNQFIVPNDMAVSDPVEVVKPAAGTIKAAKKGRTKKSL
jgi:hypothetical protein